MCTLEWQRDTFVNWYKVGQKVATWHLGFCPNQMEKVPGRFNTRHKDWTRYEDTKSYITVEDIWTSVRLSYLYSGVIWHSFILDMKVNLTLYDRVWWWMERSNQLQQNKPRESFSGVLPMICLNALWATLLSKPDHHITRVSKIEQSVWPICQFRLDTLFVRTSLKVFSDQ